MAKYHHPHLSKDINMNYYVENNLENSLPKIFGSSSAMSLEEYYCEKTWEVAMQDGCGNEIMNVNNCEPDHPKLDCSKIIPSIPSTTTAGPTAGPTVGPTTGPTVGPPVDRPTAYFLDYLHWAGDINYEYTFYKLNPTTQRYSHRMFTQGEVKDFKKLYFDENNNPMSGSGSALFWWNSPQSSPQQGVIYNPSMRIAIAHPGMRHTTNPTSTGSAELDQILQGFYIDRSVPSPRNNEITLKVYAELEDGSQILAFDKLYSFCSLMGTGFGFDRAICVPYMTFQIYLEKLNYLSLGTRIFRLELSCDLGTDIIYVPIVEHPRIACALLPLGGPYPDQNCDYEILLT